MKINLGCGTDVKEGWLNVDIEPSKGVTVMDLNKRWKIRSNSAEEIKASHVYEHVKDREHFLKELYRISKQGCIIDFRVPSYQSTIAWGSPQHQMGISRYFFTRHLKDYGFKLVKLNWTPVISYVVERLGLYPEYKAIITPGKLKSN